MENFIMWLANSFYNLISTLSGQSVNLIDNIVSEITTKTLTDFNINLVLFSDTPILSTNGYDLFALFFSVFYTIIFITIIYKIIKKVFVKIVGWRKW